MAEALSSCPDLSGINWGDRSLPIGKRVFLKVSGGGVGKKSIIMGMQNRRVYGEGPFWRLK